MFLKRLLLIAGAALVLIAGAITAQEATDTPMDADQTAADYSLRDLAARSGFYVGAAVSVPALRNDPVYAETLANEFNLVTPENVMKMETIQPRQGEFDFSQGDTLVDFAEAHDMQVHGHTLVWHNQLPGWLTSGTFTRDEAIQLLHDHISTVVGHYKGRIAYWDVVNEAVADDGSGLRDTPWRRLIGDDYIEMAFQFAHEADPDALLFYNDYGAEGGGAKSDAIYAMVQDFIERGVPINGVGLQSHNTLGTFNPGGVANNIKRLGELGLQVQITEADVRYTGATNDDVLRRQAADYYHLFNACLESEYCTAFVVWGLSDRDTWLRGSNLGFFSNPTVEPLLFDDNFQPKPAYYAVLDLLARKAGVASPMTDDQVAVMLGTKVESATPEIPPPTKSDAAQLAPDSAAGQVYYAPFPVTITLDGSEDDWGNVPRVTVDNGPMIPQSSGTTMEFAAAADDTYLYFLADVHDSKLVYGTHDPASEWYQEDSVEFYVNATGDLTLTAYEPGVAQIGIPAANIDNDDPDHPIIGGGNSDSSQVRAVVVQTDDGYRIEAAVPLETAVWSITPEHMGTIGFQVHLNGSSGQDRDTKLIWSAADTQDQSWSNPSLFGQLVFWDVNQ